MKSAITKQTELTPPQLDAQLTAGETLTVEIQQQLHGTRFVYLHLDGTSIVRVAVPASAHLITIEPADLPAAESLIDIN